MKHSSTLQLLVYSGVVASSSSELLSDTCRIFPPFLVLWGLGGGGRTDSDWSELRESFLNMLSIFSLLVLRTAELGSRWCCCLLEGSPRSPLRRSPDRSPSTGLRCGVGGLWLELLWPPIGPGEQRSTE
ncbi:hypothetical protein EYF80_025198 [Liparis tanakae]|uniref:Uncharacterized protein n=1 Tax=Liparis tanakae TaxID=230148 RepID=A0A4Z2HG34_9TELE|nr:hypothetical protein EYF80_025198 [Liparis tanakae]